jgi:diguanylate cyclase (GGDEF)-like protein
MGSLRRQSLLITASTLALCMAVGAGISHYVMERSMREFEGRDAAHTLDRINILLDLQLENMRKQATDYAVWNTTYDFMASADPEYVKENYSEAIFENLDIDSAFLIRPDGQIAMALFKADQLAPGATGMRYIANAKAMPLSEQIARKTAGYREPKVGSIMSMDGKQYIFGVSDILTNDGTGPSRGKVVFIRKLDKKRMEYLKMLAQEDFILKTDQIEDRITIGDERVVSVKTMLDTAGRPVANIIVDQPRPLKQLVTTTRNIISANALVLTLIALLFVFLMFDRLVLRKIDALVRNIFSIRQVGAIGKRLQAIGDQDIDRISSEINFMLEELSESHTRLQHEAFHDHLTGLGNRRLLLNELDDAFQSVKTGAIGHFSLFLMDLDDFKDINDLYGHLAGDHVIKVIAQRLGECARSPDLSVRLGGDEFAVLIRGDRKPDTQLFARRLLDAITRPVIWDGIALGVKASIGIVIADASSDASSNPIDWLRRADIAMYASKNRTKNGYLLFHPDLETIISERKRMERELSRMISEESSEIWMQPVLKQSDASLFALEVLSRWFHPELGEIPPAEFIRIAEETKLIDRLDRSVIRRSCARLAPLRLSHPDLHLLINVSALTLLEPDFSTFIGEQLRLHAIPDGALMLEVTETVLAGDEALLLKNISAIRELGVRFLIDDFGTGYSSLSRLDALPLDFLKIDGSFLSALDSGQDTICKTIIRMAHSLDMQVIAEGVETATQLQRLADLKCDFVQGYHFAKPMNPEQLTAYLLTN